jgi:hypothetical protein
MMLKSPAARYEPGSIGLHFRRVTSRIALTVLIAAVQPAWAGRKCDAPPETWQPRSAVSALAERNGWHVERLKVDDGCYEIRARDAEGRLLKATIDPASLKVIGVKRGHGEHDRDRAGEHQRMAPPAATPASVPTGGLTPASTSRFG